MFIHMLSDLLRTKLFPPPMRPNQVERPRLFTRLNDSLRLAQRFILVSAPAGFGKSTLIAAWLKLSKLSSIWLTLDEADNDPVRFWRYLLTGLQTIYPGFGADLQAAILTPQPPSSRTLIIPLINELAGLDTPIVIVLDDFHQIHNEEILQAVVQIIDRLPVGCAVAILTRSDPPIQLAHFRGSSDLCEIRALDLRFSLEESRTFLNEKMGLNLVNEELTALDQRTEGWVVGLQMAGLSLQGRTNQAQFIAEFSGDDRYIADYLLEEVLSRQPSDVQDFLLTTSILDRFNAQLCNELTGRQDGQAILNLLDRGNLFIIPLDNRREWFRYHHLFASLLHQMLLSTKGVKEVQALQKRLIDWYERNGQYREAAQLAISLGDFSSAGAMILQAAAAMFMDNELTTVRNLGLAIPASVVSANPSLCLLLAWANHATGHVIDCMTYVGYVEKHFGYNIHELVSTSQGLEGLTPQQRSFAVEACVVYTRVALDEQPPELVAGYCKRLLPYLDVRYDKEGFLFNPPSHLYAPLRFIQGLAEKAQGKIADAISAFEDALTESRIKKNDYIVALASTQLGWMKIAQAHLREAHLAFQELAPGKHSGDNLKGYSGPGLIGMGYLSYEHGQLLQAVEQLQSGLALGMVFRSLEDTLPGFRYLIQLYLDAHEWHKARQAVQDFERIIEKDTDPSMYVARLLLAYINSCGGKEEEAVLWLKNGHEELSKSPPYFREHSWMLFTRILMNLKHFSEAESILIERRDEAERQDRTGNTIEILAMLACVWEEMGDYDRSAQALSKALCLAEPEDYQSVFTSLGPVMCRTIIRHRNILSVSYTHRLLSTFDHPSSNQAAVTQAGLIDPLSQREIEILELIATGASNAEIAARLVISVNTVKKHTTNIFSKLGASSRIQAVELARQLGYYSR